MSGIDEIPQRVCDKERILELENEQGRMLEEMEILLGPVPWSREDIENYTAARREELLMAIRVTRETFQDYYERRSCWNRLKGWLGNVWNR